MEDAFMTFCSFLNSILLFSEQYLPKQMKETISCSFSLIFLQTLSFRVLPLLLSMTYALLSFILVLAQSSLTLPSLLVS